ncbi:MAG: biotin/lipoyl-binding protein [Lewinellaceae bacterium]|nr:biotin/lipoyl-binding protein [Lewinellaceae bacterium]
MEPEEIVLQERHEIQAMLGNNPGCLVHYGALLLGGLVLVLVALGWFINYPDTVTAHVVLSSANPPVRVLARVSGRLTMLPVQNGDSVQTGQLLAEIESNTASKDVRVLETYLNCLESQTRWQQLSGCTLPRNLQARRAAKHFWQSGQPGAVPRSFDSPGRRFPANQRHRSGNPGNTRLDRFAGKASRPAHRRF